jgi:hypothetical protein
VESKNKDTRHVPMTARVRAIFLERSLRRQRPNDPEERAFALPQDSSRFFPVALERAGS